MRDPEKLNIFHYDPLETLAHHAKPKLPDLWLLSRIPVLLPYILSEN